MLISLYPEAAYKQDLRKEDLSAATETQFREATAGFLHRATRVYAASLLGERLLCDRTLESICYVLVAVALLLRKSS
ncbi:hypothetical protein [Calothrix sp. NIES-3974]|uniref:hypothetical protein n=1 Tax=Calothrix sp. NIES-3974 TaxID=2005462 RepID=UPI000B5F7811|nr:hypothetical protein [Calothrix sp. NIES-3974]BAZ06772.1 hypothetical protein NIES3974_34340 [Calothrix sp. NIES-3974]